MTTDDSGRFQLSDRKGRNVILGDKASIPVNLVKIKRRWRWCSWTKSRFWLLFVFINACRGCGCMVRHWSPSASVMWSYSGCSLSWGVKRSREFQPIFVFYECVWENRPARWIFNDPPAAANQQKRNKTHQKHTLNETGLTAYRSILKLQHLSMLMQSTNWLEGFRVMLRNDRFTCQQTFAVHRSLNFAAIHAGCENVHHCHFPSSRSTEQISSCLWGASQSPSVYLSYKHFLCAVFFSFSLSLLGQTT